MLMSRKSFQGLFPFSKLAPSALVKREKKNHCSTVLLLRSLHPPFTCATLPQELTLK